MDPGSEPTVSRRRADLCHVDRHRQHFFASSVGPTKRIPQPHVLPRRRGNDDLRRDASYGGWLDRTAIGFVTVLKPAKLTFESFRAGSQWKYFRLEAAEIEPTGTERAYLTEDGYAEKVYDLSDGRFVSPYAWDNGGYEGDPAAKGAKHIRRYRKGAFVIFSTASPYNRASATYDARHEKMSETDFRTYIQGNADRSIE
jgi:hypothetical protein